ncbi:SLOG family protein [Mycolicibacterium neoaurum]|uniref:SLOG family protein n=1 Tax=Mycolicibacterium neoaurum TaxID=1795 RepID=UPI00248B5568|nr:SLOG family protein [Mycolicibacterium neoaurum]WBP93209.1 SLOG family protein [Mycolicibacterium neoaurum]WBS06824.1 SLOG family protein [Mycolicibacterium neoaurum]
MRVVLVTGAREWPDPHIVWGALSAQVQETGPFVLVHGDDNTGVDALAHEWLSLEDAHCELPCCDPEIQGVMRAVEEVHTSRTSNGGSRATHNQRMVDRGADVCLAFITPASASAVDCMTRARIAGISVVEYHPDSPVVVTTRGTLCCSVCNHPAIDHDADGCDVYGEYDDCTCTGYDVDPAELELRR